VDEQAQADRAGAAEGADPQPPSPGQPAEKPASTEAAASTEKPASTWDDPRIPWTGKPRRVDILCWGGIVLSGIFYWVLLPFRAPLVGTHPIVLVLLNGSTEAIVSAAAFARVGHGSLVWVLLAALFGLMKFDPLFWWAGRLWGERLIAILSGKRNRGGRYMGHVQRWGRKFTWPAVIVSPFLPIPSAIIFVIAGWAGMRLITFIILDAIGTLLWAGLLAGLGYALGHHAVVVAQAISHYGLWISIGLIVLIVIFQFRSQRHLLQTAALARQAAAAGAAAPSDPPPSGPLPSDAPGSDPSDSDRQAGGPQASEEPQRLP
jgi:membrane protein DedA with SNARE-associated domain